MKNRNHILTTILLALGLCAICPTPKVFGVVPAPDGGYPGGNTAEGQNALLSLTTGTYNTGVGIFSLLSLTDGQFCTGVGAGTLLSNAGSSNTATGAGSLLSNISGGDNTADGAFALFSNTTAGGNTANGAFALFSNTTGSSNTASGFSALQSNTTGFFNTAAGDGALADNTEGAGNTAVGEGALSNNTTGGGNIAIGVAAGNNLTAGDNNIYIGNVGAVGDSSTTRIGVAKVTQKTFIDGIRGVTTGFNDAVNVVIDSAGQLGTISSSRRFKTDIKPMDNASGSILALKPVTFRYKSQNDAKPQFGLIAEEVAEVNPDLVVRDENGEIYTVRYDAVNAMLLNEFLKEHKRVEDQQATIAELKSTVAQQQKGMETLTAQLKEQAAQIQKVSAQVKMSRPAQQVAMDQP
jgi:uncharacterized coiled-coil protein SlyX